MKTFTVGDRVLFVGALATVTATFSPDEFYRDGLLVIHVDGTDHDTEVLPSEVTKTA